MGPIHVQRRDVVWTFANLGLTSGVNVLLLPLILSRLTPEDVGLWYVFVAIGGLTLVLDLGLTVTMSRHVTFVWCGATAIERSGYTTVGSDSQPNAPLLRRLIDSVAIAYRVLGVLVTLAALTLGTWHIQGALGSTDQPSRGLIAWAVYVCAIWLNTSTLYWNPLLRGIGGVGDSSKANAGGKLVQLVLTASSLVIGFGLIGVSASYLASALAVRLLSRHYFRARTKNLDLRHGGRLGLRGRLTILRTIWPNSLRQGGVGVAQYCMATSPVLLSSAFLGLRAAAAVGVSVQVLGLVKVLGNALFNAFLPSMSALRARGDGEHLARRFVVAVGVSTWTILVLGTALFLLGPSLLDLIGSHVDLLPPLIGVTFVLSEWAINQASLSSAFLSTANQVPMFRAYIATAAITIGAQFVAVGYLGWGLWGLVIPAALASLAYNDWVWFSRAAHDMHVPTAALFGSTLTTPLITAHQRLLGR